ncbi:Alpha-(1,3)-fucosyltransferase C [Strongyloides ratti]|uniref:Fucosyltransferase n=1 Tax=Strongyloides ratti TaxID=34506 RepID=A0A090MW17_STRRB|nr:Alpha-(1,3)-fucosyltransferase C [Strongyloides ratti]CEF63318.1 Alpha-(1,3)-fucosyltransferase C [Strongyloides ratti]
MKCILIILLYLNFTSTLKSNKASKVLKKSKNPMFTILSWNSRWWEDFGVCKKYNCLYTDNRKLLKNADAIMFNDFFYNCDTDMKNIVKRPKKSTLYVNVFSESFVRNKIRLGKLSLPYPKNYFNLTYTYLPNGDIYRSYGNDTFQIKNLTSHNIQILEEKLHKSFKNKKKDIIWLVSNCETPSGRMIAVNALKKYLNVVQYGSCNKKSIKLSDNEKKKLFEKHYFYIASENTDCKHYITEKFFERFFYDSIPIVSVRKLYDGYAPPNSFIAMDDFESPQKMGEFLNKLKNDKNEYLKYFEYRKLGWVQKQEKFDSRCYICKELIKFYKSKKQRIYPDIKRWQKESNECLPNNYIPRKWKLTR